MKRLVLVDGHNLLFRMFYGIPNHIRNSKGVDIKGYVGFIGALKKIKNTFDPASMAIIFDSETSKENNVNLLSDYKSNRIDYNDVPPDDNPFTALPIIKKALDFLHVPQYEVIDNEADDYIASLAYQHKNEFDEIIIISNDSDLFQLIDDNLFIYAYRGKNSILFNKEVFQEKFGIIPDRYVEYKALVGDKADNIKGANGIGKMKACEIMQYGSIENYCLNSDNERVKNIIKNDAEIIKRNIKLIGLCKTLDTSKTSLRPIHPNIDNYKIHDILSEIGER